MDITTIQLSKEMKEKIASFGLKGESYDKILKRIYSLAVKEQLRDFLMSDEGYITIEEARKELDKNGQGRNNIDKFIKQKSIIIL